MTPDQAFLIAPLSNNMKNLVNKFSNIKKSAAKNIGKYALMSTMVLGGAAYANGQTFDYSSLPEMDVFSSPDFAKDSSYVINNNWNSLNTVENRADAKVAKAQERIPLYLRYTNDTTDCEINTDIYFFNFTGLENFKNYQGYDRDNDGKPEGYDYFKNKLLFGEGAENIPLYRAYTTNIDGIPHTIPCFFKGSNDKNVKDNPLDFSQWYFFDYLTGKEVKPGDIDMDPNSPVIIKDIEWIQDIFGNKVFNNSVLIPFYLNNGKASYKENEINPDMLKENPFQIYNKLSGIKDTTIEYQPGMDINNLNTGKPKVETNSEYYKPIITEQDGKFTPDDPKYNLFGSFTKKFFSDIKMGRHNIRDSLEQKVTIRDTTPPVLNIPADVEINAHADTSITNTGIATATDNSPYTIRMWHEDNEISNDGHYKVIERTFFAEDVSGNIGSGVQQITQNLDTGVHEAKAQGGFDVQPEYSSQGVNIKTFETENGKVSLELFNMSGQLVRQKYFGADQGTSQDWWISSSFASGTYLFKGIFKAVNGNVQVDKGKVEIK